MDQFLHLMGVAAPWIIVFGFVAVCVMAAMDPRNRKGSPDAYDEDEVREFSL